MIIFLPSANVGSSRLVGKLNEVADALVPVVVTIYLLIWPEEVSFEFYDVVWCFGDLGDVEFDSLQFLQRTVIGDMFTELFYTTLKFAFVEISRQDGIHRVQEHPNAKWT